MIGFNHKRSVLQGWALLTSHKHVFDRRDNEADTKGYTRAYYFLSAAVKVYVVVLLMVLLLLFV